MRRVALRHVPARSVVARGALDPEQRMIDKSSSVFSEVCNLILEILLSGLGIREAETAGNADDHVGRIR